MIDVVRELRERGHDVTWTVYGEGKYETAMRERIKRLGLEQVVSLKGSVPYEHLWRALEDACIFIGMGTAILEAALFKVPSLFAVPYDQEGLTYGPIYQLPAGSNGPASTNAPKRMTDEIERILRLSPAEYQAEEQAVCDHVQVHQAASSMDRFLRLAGEAAPVVRQRSRYLANYPLWLIRRTMSKRHHSRMGLHPPAPRASFVMKARYLRQEEVGPNKYLQGTAK